MAKSERVCRIGSMVLAPIAAVGIFAGICGVVGGAIWALTMILPAPGEEHSQLSAMVVGGLMFAMVITLVTTTSTFGLFPWLYAHCRGPEFLLAIQAIDAERAAIIKESDESRDAKVTVLNERRAQMIKSGRAV